MGLANLRLLNDPLMLEVCEGIEHILLGHFFLVFFSSEFHKDP